MLPILNLSHRARTVQSQRTSWCDIDVTVDVSALQNIPEKDDVAPFLVGSFDIECVPEGGRGFPDATKPLDRHVSRCRDRQAERQKDR